MEKETYGFNWHGKSEAKRIAETPSAGTLLPCKEESLDWNETQNIFIEGDNLEVLKLLQKDYFSKIKMIYIDPPYNTGKNMGYNDNFKLSKREYKKLTGTVDDGRFHINWLNMMYPRLKLARNLLKDDGVIFISIDDNEQSNLKKLCDEVFGEENFVAEFIWIKKKKGSHLSKTIRSMTEYVICYGKKIKNIELFGEKAYSDKKQPLLKRTNRHKKLIFPKNTIKTSLSANTYKAGKYGNGTTALNFISDFVVNDKGIVITDLIVSGPFVWGQAKLESEISLKSEISLSNNFGFNVLRSDQVKKVKRPSTLIDKNVKAGTNEDAYQEAIKLFGAEGIMSYPKPTSLIKYIINTITYWNKDGIIIDFFAGSATTAHAVMQLNTEDNGNRKFIMVQLPEPCNEKSEAYKAGYKTISDIGKERIRRAGRKIKEETGADIDYGFKVLKLKHPGEQK